VRGRRADDDPAVPGISVLVVDDHAVFADALQARLCEEPDLGPVWVAYSAAQMRERLSRHSPEVVLLDLMLGDGNGLQLASEIRDLSPESRTVMLTGVESADPVMTALSRGVRGWLQKTVDTGHLVRVIRGVHAGEAWLAPDLLGSVLSDMVRLPVAPASDIFATLTAREREVLQCLVDGYDRAEIATRLHVSVHTVRTHTQNLIAKLDVHSALEAVAFALRHGMRVSGS
jgi:two-component system NarL family response regulator